MSKRPWFQFHLSTAVVMMFVAGGLMWLNFQRQYIDVYEYPNARETHWVKEGYGWPLTACRVYQNAWSANRINEWKLDGVLIDSIVALLCVLIVAMVCE